MGINELITLSRRYGADPEFVLGGGGNTSWKDDSTLHVKASGVALGTIDESGFASLNLAAVRSVLDRDFPSDSSARESQVLAALMAARLPGQTMRPSVETILHALFPYAYIVHTHPALANGLLCSARGPLESARLFGGKVLWIDYTTPGYVLSKALKDAFAGLGSAGEPVPRIVFLQNHGVFVAADEPAEIEAIYAFIFGAIQANVTETPQLAPLGAETSWPDSGNIERQLGTVAPGSILRRAWNPEAARFLASAEAFAPLSDPFTPDHIVYAGARPLYLAAEDWKLLPGLWKEFTEREGFAPRIVAVRSLGVFAIGASPKAADLALALFSDAMKIARYSFSFGGPKHMATADVEFIKRWEVEQYRSSVAAR